MTRKSHSLSVWRTRWHNEMSLCVIMQCNQNLLFYKTLPFLQSLFSTSKSIKIYWGWFHQDIKAFLRVSAGRVMQKGSKIFPGYRRDFSDSSGLHRLLLHILQRWNCTLSPYTHCHFKSFVVSWGAAGRDYSGFPRALKNSGRIAS